LHTSTKLIIFCLLAALTSGSALFIDRYRESGPELLTNPLFADGLTGWQINGDQAGVAVKAGVLSLTSLDSSKNVGIIQPITVRPELTLVRLSGIISSQQIKAGKKNWHKGRLLLASLDEHGKWLPVSHEVISLTGNNPEQHYEHIFTISPAAKELRVTIQLNHCTGAMTARELSLRPVSQTPYHPWLKWSLLTLWLLFLLRMLTPPPGADHGRIMKFLVYAVAGLIIVGTFMPSQYKEELKQTVENQSAPITGIAGKIIKQDHQPSELPHDPEYNIDKISHFAIFLLFALLRLRLVGPRRIGQVLVEILILAGASELMQLYADGRSALLTDVVIDYSGGLFGIGLAGIIGKKQQGHEG